MKNFVIAVLVIAVGVLGFLLYKSRRHGLDAGKQHANIRIAGTKHKRHDKQGNNVDTQDCSLIINNDTCVIPISTLRTMWQQGNDSYAFEVHHGDKIIWFGDGGESLAVQPLKGIACPGSTAPPPNTYLTDTITQPGILQIGYVTGDPGSDDQQHDLYCYKTTVSVTVGVAPNTTTTQVDPHMFDVGQ